MAAVCDTSKYQAPETYTRPPGFDIKVSGTEKNMGRPYWVDLSADRDKSFVCFCDEGETIYGPVEEYRWKKITRISFTC